MARDWQYFGENRAVAHWSEPFVGGYTAGMNVKHHELVFSFVGRAGGES
jgi:hypothetical protein